VGGWVDVELGVAADRWENGRLENVHGEWDAMSKSVGEIERVRKGRVSKWSWCGVVQYMHDWWVQQDE
jgi:hypothetical protein